MAGVAARSRGAQFTTQRHSGGVGLYPATSRDKTIAEQALIDVVRAMGLNGTGTYLKLLSHEGPEMLKRLLPYAPSPEET